jgi:hypothetical protein
MAEKTCTAQERNRSASCLLNAGKSMTLDDELRAPQPHLTQCRSLPGTAPGQGRWPAFLACLALLLLPSDALSVSRILTGTIEEISNSKPVMTRTAKDAQLFPLLGVYAQATAYAADPGKPLKKGAREFFPEFLDLLLKAVISINFVVTILAAVKLWLDQRAAKRRRKDLRICPACYSLVRRRNATRCPFCRVELTPESRFATLSPRPEPDRYEPARQEPTRRTQPQQPVHKEPIREEPPRDGPQEQEGEDWEEEEWEPDEWERQEERRRRKVTIYTFVFTTVVGWVAAALLVLLRLV